MPRYVIERDIPEVGTFEREALREAAGKSNGVLADMKAEKKNIQWEHSYVAGDKTFCIYLADERGAHPRARGEEWVPGERRHRGAQDDRPRSPPKGDAGTSPFPELQLWPPENEGSGPGATWISGSAGIWPARSVTGHRRNAGWKPAHRGRLPRSAEAGGALPGASPNTCAGSPRR